MAGHVTRRTFTSATIGGAALAWVGPVGPVGSARAAAEAIGDPGGSGVPKTVYVSTADYQYLTGYPMDSVATIKAHLETLKERFNADTVWWRGYQDDLVLQTHLLRPEYRLQYDWWQWVKHLNYEVRTNATVGSVARDLGMKLWTFTSLFDWGSQAGAGFNALPYTIEYKLRVKHPEFAPLNKYGTRLLGGPVEFCYPQARRHVVKDLVQMAVRNRLDGVMLYTYAENMTLRYFDEFGFNRPIVDEYRRRHGVDIRHDPFDREELARLRGEYVTEFLRELRAALQSHDIGLGIQVDPTASHLPRSWGEGATLPPGYSSPEWDPRPASHIYLDWERWVDERLVDELSVSPWHGPESDAMAQQLLTATQGTGIKASQYLAKGDLVSDSVERVTTLSGDEMMCGFGWDTNAEWGPPIEALPEQPISNLRSPDQFARRRVLYLISRGLLTAPTSDIVSATGDPDVFARIYAVRSLRLIDEPAALAALDQALRDPENSVRIEAVYSIAKNPGTTSIGTILDAVWRPNVTWQFVYIAVESVLPALASAGRITEADVATLLHKAKGNVVLDRRHALDILRAAGMSTDPRVGDLALRVLATDRDVYMQEYAIRVLGQSASSSTITEALRRAVRERGESVQVRATVALLTFAHVLDPSDAGRIRTLADAVDLFKEYGDRCRRDDADWGWREVGYGILGLGADGAAALTELMSQHQDRQVAYHAWHLLYIKQQTTVFVPTTAAEDAAAHAARPHAVLGLPPV